jgi:hypothetical protein
MMDIHTAAAETVPSNFTRNTILPFHDGGTLVQQQRPRSA